MYFKDFPKILYDFEINGKREVRLITDITVNVRIRRAIFENITLYDEYDIGESETPEIIAAKVYGSPIYHWVIMMCNERYDNVNDFPLSYNEFESYVKGKYGDAVEGIHHHENVDGYVVNSDVPGAVAVTNYEYEYELNESKRRIKLISKGSLFNLLSQFKNLI